MSYSWQRVQYGIEPHQWMEVGTPDSLVAGAKLRCYMYLPGGGWGLRDKRTLDHPTIGVAIFRSAYNNPASSHYESSIVVYVNAASNTYNGMSNFFPFPWATSVRMYDVGDWVADANSIPYECIASNEPDKNAIVGHAHEGSEPGVGANWTSFWVQRTRIECAQAGRGNPLHVIGQTWNADETTRAGNGNQYVCKQTHTSTALTDPNGGAQAADYWERLFSNDIITPRIGGMGEMTPAFGVTGSRDMQLATQFLRANADKYQIFVTKITHAGESAGGHNVGLANALEDHSYAYLREAEGNHLYTPEDQGRANAQILSYFPTHLEDYYTVYPGSEGLGSWGASMKSLFGNSDLSTWTGWSEYPAKYKRAVDVLGAIEASGITIPTYLSYTDGGSLTSHTVSNVYSNDGGHSANAHHAHNGWRLFERFRSPITTGGFGLDNCIFLCRNAADSAYERHTEYDIGFGTLGTTYTEIPLTADALGQEHADWIVATVP